MCVCVKDSLKETQKVKLVRKKRTGIELALKIMLNTFHAPVNMEFIEHGKHETLNSQITNYFDTEFDNNSFRAFILSPISLIKPKDASWIHFFSSK